MGIEAEPVSRPSGERQHELTICLQVVRGDRIYALYSSPSEPLFAQDYLDCRGARSAAADWLANGALPREAESLGPALFTLLFGPAEKGFCNRIINRVFNSDQMLPPNRYPLRVRLQTDNPLLRQLPWRHTSWQDRPLWEDGWTFECLPAADTTEPPQYSDAQLSTPCEVLIVAPEDHGGPLRSDPHCLGLEQLFQTLWSEHDWPWPPLRAASRQELERTLKERTPRIVYYYGPAEASDDELVLLLRGSQKLTLKELGAIWTKHPPRALFLNLAGRSLRQGMGSVAGVLPAVPFAAVQVTSSDDTLPARQSGIRWLEGVLRGHDPVWALHAYGLPDASAWSAYRRWQALAGLKPTSADLIELLLDRHNQRGLLTSSVIELVQNRDRRLQAVVVHGEPGNRVTHFSIQLLNHLKRDARESVVIKHLPLPLPNLSKPFDRQAVEQRVRRHLGLEWREPIARHLEKLAPSGWVKPFP